MLMINSKMAVELVRTIFCGRDAYTQTDSYKRENR